MSSVLTIIMEPGFYKYFCDYCHVGFHSRNKEHCHWISNGFGGAYKCGSLITRKQLIKKIRDWNKKHPDQCGECDGQGYIVIGGTESEVCYCRKGKKKR